MPQRSPRFDAWGRAEGRWCAAETGLGACISPIRLGGTRASGIDLNKPRSRTALAALALAGARHGFTAAEFTAKARQLNTCADYTIRQRAYDLRKLRGKGPRRQAGEGSGRHADQAGYNFWGVVQAAAVAQLFGVVHGGPKAQDGTQT
jgi:hypothetical protein